MGNRIKIARSITRANLPEVLEYGEQAYVKNAKLVIGNGDGSEFVVNDYNNLINAPGGSNDSGDTGPVLSVNGQTGAVVLTKSDLSLANVENTTLSTWAGSAYIATVGTITTGVWNGTVIPNNKGGTGLSFIGGDNQILGVNGDGTALEYKTFSSSDGSITITPILDAMNISVTSGHYLPVSGGTVSGDLTVTGNIYASRNDVVDFVDAPKIQKVEYGRVYVRTSDYRVVVASDYNQIGILGIASDTFGMSVGKLKDMKQVPIAIAGFVLAFVDKLYAPGTALTCSADGVLTRMLSTEKKAYPERIVATFDRPETEETWNGVSVRGRCWVKVV